MLMPPLLMMLRRLALRYRLSSSQCLKGVSSSLHVGFAYEPVGAFRVPVAYGYGTVPVLEDLGIEVTDRFGEGSKRVEQFSFGDVVLPCLERFLGVALRGGILVPDVEEILLDVEGRCERLKLVDAAQQAYFLGFLAGKVATTRFKRIGKSALGFDAVLLGHGRLQGPSHGVYGLVGLHDNVEVVDGPACVRHGRGDAFLEWPIHIGAHPHDLVPVWHVHEVLGKGSLISSVEHVVERAVFEIGDDGDLSDALDLDLVDAEERGSAKP